MAILLLAMSLSAAVPPVEPGDGGFGPQDSWWECYYSYRAGDGGAGASGRLLRYYTLDGRGRGGVYETWPPDLRVSWHLVDTPDGVRPRVSYLSMEIPTTFPRNGGAVYGYLFADGERVATTTMLDVRSARRGYAVSTAFFQGTLATDIATPLERSDRWSLVVMHADGTEVLRRDLPVPPRRAREEVFARHWMALETAWRDRDSRRLVTTHAETLPRDRGSCLLSTPAARQELEDTSIGFIE